MSSSIKHYFTVVFALFLLNPSFLRAEPNQSPDFTDALKAKLATAFEAYQSAKTLMQTSSFEAPLVRSVYEDKFAKNLLNDQDLKQLKEVHDQIADLNKNFAKQKSAFDFDSWRSSPQGQSNIQKFCAQVPKGGLLHIHPSGTLDQNTVKELLMQQSLDLTPELRDLQKQFKLPQGVDPLDPSSNLLAFLYDDEIQKLSKLQNQMPYSKWSQEDQSSFLSFFVMPFGANPFARFQAVFSFVSLALEDTFESRLKVYEDFIKRNQKLGVDYVEFTTGMRASQKSLYEKIAQELEQKYGVKIRYNVAFSRTLPLKALQPRFEELGALKDSTYVTGIDLLADETHTPALETASFLYAQTAKLFPKLKMTQHAGELGDVRDPRDAILMGAQRLGHGVKLSQDELTLEYARQNKISVEINLTSNLKLGSVKTISSHPYLRYFRLGLPVSLSTDDEGIFETDIQNECQLALSATDVQYFEYRQMIINSIEQSFVEPILKDGLIVGLRSKLDEFERKFNPSL